MAEERCPECTHLAHIDRCRTRNAPDAPECSCLHNIRLAGPVPLDFSKLLAAAETMADGMKFLSSLLTPAVRALTDEGWSEDQARDLVVVSYRNSVTGGSR